MNAATISFAPLNSYVKPVPQEMPLPLTYLNQEQRTFMQEEGTLVFLIISAIIGSAVIYPVMVYKYGDYSDNIERYQRVYT